MSTIPLKRITLYKNDLGYFERRISSEQTPAVVRVAKKHKKLVIDTLCTTANAVTFDTEAHEKYVAENSIERFFAFNDLTSSTSFATFLSACIGTDIGLFSKGSNKEENGKLVMLDEVPTLLGPDAKETTTLYTLRVLNKDGIIHSYERE